MARQQQYDNEYERDDEEINVILHKSEGRIQNISHAISSLEKPTLENVEALMVF